jgi:hypothetical protein
MPAWIANAGALYEQCWHSQKKKINLGKKKGQKPEVE